jgi:uncharacterized protein (DUF1800 family)
MSIAPFQALNRFGLGARAGETPPANPHAWLAAQLDGPDPGLASPGFATLPTAADGLIARRTDLRERKKILAAGLPLKGNFKAQTFAMLHRDVKAQIDFALTTNAPFRERLVWFWANHFTVSTRQGGIQPLVGPYLREAIRPHVTGKFTDMVLAVERHPAMLLYLGNAFSTGPNSRVGQRIHRGLNENLGRECMELHTVSLRAGYHQSDVTNMAKLLTGWSINPQNQPTGFMFRPFLHEPGPQTLMGRTFPGGEQGGIEALRFLSTYPTTWVALATKLVRHFVADQPPQPAINHIASVLADTGGDLRAASLALIDLPDAATPLTKIKTPFDYVLSSLRAAGLSGLPVGMYLGVLNRLGQPLWRAPLPNGWSDLGADWSGSDAVLGRIDFGYTLAARIHESDPLDLAHSALGPLLRAATIQAIRHAGSKREALSLLFAAPEFQRR